MAALLSPKHRSPRRERRLRLLLAGVSGLLALLVAEVTVRALFRYNTPDTVRENSLEFVPSVYARHRMAPDQEVDPEDAFGLREGEERAEILYAINNAGFRGRDVAAAKPEGTCRIAVLGGSAAFDVSAGRDEDWPHLVEIALREGGHLDAEVVNAGVPGHTSADAIGRLFTEIWTLEPDFVLLYNAWNDIKYFRELTRESPLIAQVAPYDEAKDPFRTYRNPLDRLLGHSQVYIKLRNQYFLRTLEVGSEGAAGPGALVDDYDPLAVDQYRLDAELFVDGSRNIGAVPVLVTQATLVTPTTRPEDRERIAYEYTGLTHDALVRAVTDCNETLARVAARKGADLIDLSWTAGRPELFDDHVHTTRLGSREIARYIAEFLAPRLGERCAASRAP